MNKNNEENYCEELYKIIGNNIHELRIAKEITAKDLAEKCNLSYGYIRNLESVKVKATISIETLSMIANALEVDITDLLKQHF